MSRDGVIVAIENFTPQEAKNGRRYYSFWVRVLMGPYFISISGWKYFPDTAKLSTPSQNKGGTKFINTTKTSAELYNRIQELAHEMFGRFEESFTTDAA